MEAIATWFAHTLGQHVSAQFVIFIVSMIPLLECRGGLIVASLLKVNWASHSDLCDWKYYTYSIYIVVYKKNLSLVKTIPLG